MPVADIMTRRLITVSPQTPVGDLQPLFKTHRIHHLLVVEDHQLLGIVSDRDVLRNISPFAHTSAADKKDAFTLSRKAEQIMNKKIVSVGPQAGIREACATLLDNDVSLLPVIDSSGLIGVLSWKDVLRHFLR